MDVVMKDSGSTETVTDSKGAAEAKLNTGLTSKQVDLFWEVVWPQLVKNGWKKVINTSISEGNVETETINLATKTDIDFETDTKDEDYYVTIKGALDRINERRNAAESTAADKYRRAASRPEKKIEPDFRPSFTRQRRSNGGNPTKLRRTKTVASPGTPEHLRMDLSWKDGGKVFPQKSSSVGEEFQVSTIPAAGTYSNSENASSETYCELVWDPKQAKEKGIILEEGKDIISGLAYNIREPALLALASADYNVEEFQSSVVKDLKPSDGSDWSQEQKDQFHAEVFRCRRDLLQVSKTMDIKMDVCHTYYLTSYKSTCDYRLLKTICIDEREQKDEEEAEQGVDACAVCGDGGNLIICDHCEGEYHINCLKPVLRDIPKGHWECDECVNSRVLEARNFLIRRSKLFERVDTSQNKKRSFDNMKDGDKDDEVTRKEGSGASGEVIFKPVDPVLDAVRKMASSVRAVLSQTQTQGTA